MTAIIAVVAVAVIVGAGCGVFLLGDDGGDETLNKAEFTSYHGADSYAAATLTVFGNADNDSDIDADDLTTVTSIAALYTTLTEKTAAAKLVKAESGEDSQAYKDAKAEQDAAQTVYDNAVKDLPTYQARVTYGGNAKAYYVADANCDGKISSIDVTMIEAILDVQTKLGSTDITSAKTDADLLAMGITPIDIFYFDVDSVITKLKYPLAGDMAIGYKSNFEAALILGANGRCTYADDQVASAVIEPQYYNWYHGDYSAVKSYGDRFIPTYEAFTPGGENHAPQMFITGTRAWYDVNMENALQTLGTSVVRLPFWEDNVCTSSIVTLGFLIGCPNAAAGYVAKEQAVLNVIEDYVKDIAYEDRPFVFASYNASSITKLHNGVDEAIWAAGGCTSYDYGYTNGSVTAEVIANMGADWITFSQYHGFLESYDVANKGPAAADKAFDKIKTELGTDGKHFKQIDHTQAFKDKHVMFFEQGTYMGPASYVTIAFIFNHLYADDIEAGKVAAFDVDALFSDYLASYHPGYTIGDFQTSGANSLNVQYFDLSDYNKKVSA